METKDILLEDICKIAQKIKPHLKITHGCTDGGRGFVRESLFAFTKSGYLWIVVLCDTGRVAFKKITPEWIQLFSNLVLSSQEVFVVFDRRHHIVEWAVAQDKACPYIKDHPKEKPKESPKEQKDIKEHKDPKDHKDTDPKDPNDLKDHKRHK